jgi:hypothetical protein
LGSAKEGLPALSVGVGLSVLAELLEEEVVEIVARSASTSGNAPPSVTGTRLAR